MFVLYKLTDIPEYSINGELPYILDKKSLLNFCNYFGGRTIKIPTIEELYSMMNLLMLYQYVNIENKSYEESIKLIGYDSKDLRKVKKAYLQLCDVLKNYNFKSRLNYDNK